LGIEYQWFALPAFSGNPTKRVASRPKGYLADTGLACHHAQLSSPRALAGHPWYGALFETAMAGELIKQAAALSTRPVFYHWRSAGGAEVDFILERDGMLYPFEIKLTAAPNRRMASGIEAFRQAHPHLKVATGALLCATELPRWISAEVMALPWNLL
jgi:predicted AAA+ superfamily ATPase